MEERQNLKFNMERSDISSELEKFARNFTLAMRKEIDSEIDLLVGEVEGKKEALKRTLGSDFSLYLLDRLQMIVHKLLWDVEVEERYHELREERIRVVTMLWNKVKPTDPNMLIILQIVFDIIRKREDFPERDKMSRLVEIVFESYK